LASSFLFFWITTPQGRFLAFVAGGAAGLSVVFVPWLAPWIWHRNWRPRRQFGLGTLLTLVAAHGPAASRNSLFPQVEIHR
jgi:hypothetical protein